MCVCVCMRLYTCAGYSRDIYIYIYTYSVQKGSKDMQWVAPRRVVRASAHTRIVPDRGYQNEHTRGTRYIYIYILSKPTIISTVPRIISLCAGYLHPILRIFNAPHRKTLPSLRHFAAPADPCIHSSSQNVSDKHYNIIYRPQGRPRRWRWHPWEHRKSSTKLIV